MPTDLMETAFHRRGRCAEGTIFCSAIAPICQRPPITYLVLDGGRVVCSMIEGEHGGQVSWFGRDTITVNGREYPL